MPNVTMAFDEEVQGWTSEFSFVPDSALSLNNKFYTFHRGRVWQHNRENVPRNNYYGLQGSTEISFVFNEAPTVVKNFKTLSYEGLGTWSAEIETNQENGEVPLFVEKEGKNYSWIRGEDLPFEPDLKSSSVQGLGRCQLIGGTQLNMSDKLPGGLTPGDILFKVEGPLYNGDPILFGVVNERIDDTNISFTTLGLSGVENLGDAPATGDFIIYTKDNSKEKSGIIGYYSIVTMTNSDTTDSELFSAGSTIFLSTQ